MDQPRAARDQLFGKPEGGAAEDSGASADGEIFPVHAQNERGEGVGMMARSLGGQGSSSMKAAELSTTFDARNRRWCRPLPTTSNYGLGGSLPVTLRWVVP